MPLNKNNCKVFHRTLYAGQLVTVTLLKRNDDLQQGTVRKITLHQCRQSRETKSGQTIQQDVTAGKTTVWHIPRVELDRVGVAYLSALDRIIGDNGAYWQPEAPNRIEVKLFRNMINLDCVSIDPTAGNNVYV